MNIEPIAYDAGNGPDVPVSSIFSVTIWKSAKGEMMEENSAPFGWRLPDDVPRFIGVATALAQELGGGPGVQIPYRFALVAETVLEAFQHYAAVAQVEGQKAYQRWVKSQQRPRVLKPGQMSWRG